MISAVSFLELAANSGRSRTSHAPNLHLAMQLLTIFCSFNADMEGIFCVLMFADKFHVRLMQ